MSWSDVFPVLTDELVDEYAAGVGSQEEVQLSNWFAVSRIERPRKGKHLVAASLYWQRGGWGEVHESVVTKRMMKNALKLGLAPRYDPWEHYVQPLLDGAELLKKHRPDVVFRVYLAADLEFLVSDLVRAGCEVMLMESGSLNHNPGALWRFLALEEQDRWVTITDSDLARDILDSVVRTELIMKSGLGLWRIPYIFGSVRNDNHPGYYRPINASQWGATGGYPVSLLLKALLWHTQRGTMPDRCVIGPKNRKSNKLGIYGTKWPVYGFDEWFLLAALYPRMAFGGVLTFFPINQRETNHWFSLDIEYVTWANARSEMLYFGDSDLLKKDGKMTARTKAGGSGLPSPVLERMLEGKIKERDSAPKIETPKQRRLPPLTLVVARYREDIRWVEKLPKDIKVVVYNKGPEITGQKLLARIDLLISLPNRGREADTYLCHLQRYPHGPADEWTVFCQGDPFPHSPNLLQLLQQRDAWEDVQPLTNAYTQDGIIPPGILTKLETDEWVRGIPVRTEFLGCQTLRMISWHDAAGDGFIESYCKYYAVPAGWSVTGHFLESCGLTAMAEKAWRAILVRGAYAAIFAVRNDRLSNIPRKSLPRMRKLACEHPSVGYVYERLWLHLFGLPFIGLEKNAKSGTADEPRLASIQ